MMNDYDEREVEIIIICSVFMLNALSIYLYIHTHMYSHTYVYTSAFLSVCVCLFVSLLVRRVFPSPLYVRHAVIAALVARPVLHSEQATEPPPLTAIPCTFKGSRNRPGRDVGKAGEADAFVHS